MENEPNPKITLPPKKRLSMLALPLAFLPSVLLIGLIPFFWRSNFPAILFIALCALTIVCCLWSAILLIQRNTPLAILVGIGFFLLNGAISFFFGCAALLTGL